MNRTGIKVQGIVGRGIAAGALNRRERCHVEGCRREAFGGRYCGECQDQIDFLGRWNRLHDKRENRAAMALFHAGRAVRGVMWIPLTVGVIVALMYMGVAWAPAVVEWLEWGTTAGKSLWPASAI